MQKQQVETRVADQVARVLAGGQAEDDYVECKGEWYGDHRKSARQIAGLCNAARGDEAMWIVGVDEDAHQLRPLPTTEHSNWWAQVRKHFAGGVAPELDTLVVPVADGSVVALVFTTDRAPYAVKVAEHQVSLEVPWREANSTTTATRSQLLRLLVANAGTPALELIDPVVSCISSDTATFEADLFVSATERAMLPNHRWSLSIFSNEWDAEGWGPLRPTLEVHRIGIDGEGPGVRVLDHSGIYVDGSGRVSLRAELGPNDAWTVDHRRTLRHQPFLRVVLDMPTDRHGRSARATATLRDTPTNTIEKRWRER
ncbi:hypothetical protein [Dietzia cercidiphylli]|uniref:Schlafen AlbA-2 domain-containing protein n=1 Tax=Dietzia cercidiphylli TaxID=498199 RepID=A0ABP4V592_9ACTN|nr:hypothetical protein [Dietzia cercidiphylli]MBB1048361.1 hypothetical protein [Dietzia cercidiphylli]